eukprot:Hpha_TRINITY_DN16859_c2_g7::TRINITY_DN16859_c2_g7_i1::g.152594::m.152594
MGGTQAKEEQGRKQPKEPKGEAGQKLPKYARAGNVVEALWEGEWWKATIVSTSRNKWQAEVEWASEGGCNDVSLDDIRPLTSNSPPPEAPGKSKQAKQDDLRKAKEKQKREAEKAAARREAEKEQAEIDEKRAAVARKGRERSEESQRALMKVVADAVNLATGALCVPLALISIFLAAVTLCGAAVVGVATAMLPTFIILAPLAHFLKGGEDKFHAAAMLKAAMDADYGITDSPPRAHSAAGATGGGGKGKKQMSSKERKQAAAEKQQEGEAAAKKQTQTIIRLLTVTFLVVAAVVGVSLLDLRKEAKGPDFYKLLGVEIDAEDAAIISAYKKLSRAWHPDKHRGETQDEAKEKMMLLNEAKTTLLDPKLRQEYDDMRDLTSKLGYEEPTFTYAAKHHWLIEAYLSCPEVMGEGAVGAVVCSSFPLAHLFWHPVLAYALFSWAHFGDVPLAGRRGANAACITGILLAAASFALGFFLFSAMPATLPVVMYVVMAVPMTYVVDFFLIRTETTGTKKFAGGGKPMIKTESTRHRPSWLPSVASWETLSPSLSSLFSKLQQDVEHVECADGEQRLVGAARLAELRDMPQGYLKPQALPSPKAKAD